MRILHIETTKPSGDPFIDCNHPSLFRTAPSQDPGAQGIDIAGAQAQMGDIALACTRGQGLVLWRIEFDELDMRAMAIQVDKANLCFGHPMNRPIQARRRAPTGWASKPSTSSQNRIEASISGVMKPV